MNPSELRAFMEALRPGPAERILDVGAGNGSVAQSVLQSAERAEVFAIDPNPRRVAEMKRKAPGVRAEVARAEKIPFPDSSFDKAYTTMALHHFSELDSALSEISRVLKPGGSFVIMEVNPRSLKARGFSLFGRLTGERMNLIEERRLAEKLKADGRFAVDQESNLGSAYLIRLVRI